MFSLHRIREVTFINYFINRQTNFTIPPPGQYFQWTNFVILGGLEPCIHLLFSQQAFSQLNYKTSFCLDVIASHPHSTTLGLPRTAIVDFKVWGISHYPLNSCKIYLNPDYFVTPARLELATPTLKVLCSTNWAMRSFHIFQTKYHFFISGVRIDVLPDSFYLTLLFRLGGLVVYLAMM